jgi:peptidoglycan hydrolase-like protein with peptidoglycan-binding domain
MALSSPWFKDDPDFINAAENDPPLMKGDMSPAVGILQQALIELGYPLPKSTQVYGRPDSDYGSETKAAVQAFQRAHGLAGEADGRVGRNTLAKLDQRMVLLGKPKPGLPPLPSGPAIDPLAAEVVAILREPNVQMINFSYEWVWFGGSLLQQVADAIEQGKIRVAYDPELDGWAEYIPFNDVQQKNQFNFSFSNPQGSVFKRSVVVHEAVHAYMDIQGYARYKYSSEGLAYAVQAWYHMAVMRHSATPVELADDTLGADVFRAAIKEIQEARAAELPVISLHGVTITAALKLVPAYAQMADTIPYDGVN